jgi:hypothetical protein
MVACRLRHRSVVAGLTPLPPSGVADRAECGGPIDTGRNGIVADLMGRGVRLAGRIVGRWRKRLARRSVHGRRYSSVFGRSQRVIVIAAAARSTVR